jgi:hypothetical protein
VLCHSILPPYFDNCIICLYLQFVEDGEERVVVGSLDLNQCLWLPDELTGKRPGVRFTAVLLALLLLTLLKVF